MPWFLQPPGSEFDRYAFTLSVSHIITGLCQIISIAKFMTCGHILLYHEKYVFTLAMNAPSLDAR